MYIAAQAISSRKDVSTLYVPLELSHYLTHTAMVNHLYLLIELVTLYTTDLKSHEPLIEELKSVVISIDYKSY